MKTRIYASELVRARLLALGIIIGLAGSVGEAMAQSTPRDLQSEGQQFQVTPYLWGASLVGQLGIGNRTADVDASFANILDHLHFAAMGMADARWNRIVAASDALYIDLRGHSATAGPLFSSVDPQQKLFILTPEAGYRVLATDSTSVDIVGGIRYWHLASQLTFQPGVLSGIDLQASRNWVDGIAGARVTQMFNERVRVSAYGDAGAGGSTHTFQLAGAVTYDLHNEVSLIGGYRYLDVNYDSNVMMDTSFKGPLVGLTFRF